MVGYPEALTDPSYQGQVSLKREFMIFVCVCSLTRGILGIYEYIDTDTVKRIVYIKCSHIRETHMFSLSVGHTFMLYGQGGTHRG